MHGAFIITEVGKTALQEKLVSQLSPLMIYVHINGAAHSLAPAKALKVDVRCSSVFVFVFFFLGIMALFRRVVFSSFFASFFRFSWELYSGLFYSGFVFYLQCGCLWTGKECFEGCTCD